MLRSQPLHGGHGPKLQAVACSGHKDSAAADLRHSLSSPVSIAPTPGRACKRCNSVRPIGATYLGLGPDTGRVSAMQAPPQVSFQNFAGAALLSRCVW